MKANEALKFKAEAGMEPCWIVWEAAADGGRPYLVAVDTSEEQANLHVRAKKEESRVLDRPPPMIRIDESWLDHLYGESMTKSFDEAKKMAREVLRAQVAELKDRLRRAITIAREETSRSELTPHQQVILERSRDDARIADDTLSTTKTAENFVLLDNLVQKLVPTRDAQDAKARLDELATLEKIL